MKTTFIGYLLISILFINTSGAEPPVYFPDDNLKAVVEVSLGVSDPTPTDMLDLIDFDCINKNVQDITGLEYAVNLESLSIRLNRVIDSLDPLADLVNLRELNISHNKISDLSPLAGMRYLEHLDAHKNNFSDLTPLEGMQDLRFFDFHHNPVSDLSPLATCTNLEDLRCYGAPVTDVTPLSELINLGRLIISGTRVRNISALLDLQNLFTLDLGGCSLSQSAYCSELEAIYHNNSHLNISTGGIKYSPPSFAPTSFNASDGVYPDRVKLTWNEVCSGPNYTTYYQVSRADISYGKKIPISPWQTDPTFEDITAQPGQIYYYWIQIAVSSQGDKASRYSFFEVGSVLEVDTIIVDDDAPDDPVVGDSNNSDPLENGTIAHPYDSIQEAIELAPEHATIVIKPGTYRESLQLSNKPIHLAADDPNAIRYPEVIGNYSQPTVTIDSNRDVKHSISGLVISGGLNGIDCRSGDLTITHCVIAGNRGSGVFCQESSVTINNCTIADNMGDPGGSGLNCLEGSEVSLANSILWNNYPSNIHLQDDTVLHARYSNISGLDLLEPGEGNMNKDPLFAITGYWRNPVDAFDQETWVPGNYHLQSQTGRWDPLLQTWIKDLQSSPCIDTGDPLDPVDYEPDPNGGVINLGAYGGTSMASKSK